MIPRPLIALRGPTHRPRPAASPRLRAAVLLGVALPVLALAGVLGRLAWTPAAPVASVAPAPQVWISSLILPDPPALARMGVEGAMPGPAARVTAALPQGALAAPGPAGAPGPDLGPGPFAAPAPRILLTPADPAPPPRAGLTDLPEAPVVTATARPRTGAGVATGPAPEPSGDAIAGLVPDNALAGLAPPAAPTTLAEGAENDTARGLRRSPLPPARPALVVARSRAEGATPALAALPAPEGPAADNATAGGLALAPLQTARPSARPAAVARLAALPPAIVPLGAPAAPPASTAVTTAALAVPPLTDSAEGCAPALTRAIPRRPQGAEGGRAAMARLTGAGGSTRDAALVRAIEGGDIPDHLRRLVPVTLSGTDAGGRRARITLCVMPDYLALGSDRDFVRVPMGLPAASRLAERFDMILPTARMVDAIHAQAQLRLAPSPMTPGAQMASTDYVLRHNATVEAQRTSRSAALGVLVSGHKKDLVITNRLTQVSGRVAIYGWHRANGQPIQPLSTVHGQHYADYSHGVRLISRTAFLNGRAVDLRDLLADGRYAGLLTGEGPIATRTLLAALR